MYYRKYPYFSTEILFLYIVAFMIDQEPMSRSMQLPY